jgi:hypothetical protein
MKSRVGRTPAIHRSDAMTPADRAARLRVEFERRFNESRDDLLAWLQDAMAEALVETEVDVRREYPED